MFSARGFRIMLLSFAIVTAIALVVAAGPVAARADGEETFTVSVNSQASMRTGDYCTAYANFSGGTGPYDFTWDGDLWYGSNHGFSSIRSDYLNDSGTFTQTLHATDANMNPDTDIRMGLEVDPDGDECFFVP